MKLNYQIQGMHCKSCVMIVQDALEELGAKNIKISLDEKKQIGSVSLDFEGDKKEIIKIIEKEGYKVK